MAFENGLDLQCRLVLINVSTTHEARAAGTAQRSAVFLLLPTRVKRGYGPKQGVGCFAGFIHFTAPVPNPSSHSLLGHWVLEETRISQGISQGPCSSAGGDNLY